MAALTAAYVYCLHLARLSERTAADERKLLVAALAMPAATVAETAAEARAAAMQFCQQRQQQQLS